MPRWVSASKVLVITARTHHFGPVEVLFPRDCRFEVVQAIS